MAKTRRRRELLSAARRVKRRDPLGQVPARALKNGENVLLAANGLI